MDNHKFFGSLLTGMLMWIISSVSAAPLDGLWLNERQNITVQIRQEDNGLRAKRNDQFTWYRYRRESNNRYVDTDGNAFMVLNDNTIEWTEGDSDDRIVFYREGTDRNDQQTSRDDRQRDVPWINRDRKSPRDDDRQSDDDRWEDRDERWTKSEATVGSVTGRWYNKSSKERLEIERTNNGYRVRTQHGQWEKYMADRSGSRLRSNSGDIIRVLDRNTIQYRRDGGADKIFVRQGNGNKGHSKSEEHTRAPGHSKGKGHAKHDHKGKHGH